ncbi:nuclear transport factor 2 family protein [uncultured Microscilla sp.]|uniref:nuclear transport factor 2 family protein n=1 Tax=uncultured Microscilla sp. TaxID=432653 RepID=UPI00260463EE|nr:nuclear transport factor 2 family protein [uncultured Microscilla sp.]
MEQLCMNKSIVKQFYTDIIGQQNAHAVDRLLTDDYIQHNPMVKTGKAGLLETLEILKSLPKDANQPTPELGMMAEGDLVFTHFKVAFAGQQKLVAEMFRLENGLIAEHWDAIQAIDDYAWEQVITMSNGQQAAQALTDVSHRKIQQLYDKVLLLRQYENLERFLVANVTLHAPDVTQGIERWVARHRKYKVDKVHRVVVEGNMVAVQSSGIVNGKAHVIYAMYCLDEKAHISKHWLTVQAIPAQMAHNNGMI